MAINWVKFYDKRCKIRSKIMLIFLQILLCFNLHWDDSIRETTRKEDQNPSTILWRHFNLFPFDLCTYFDSSLMRWILINFIMENLQIFISRNIKLWNLVVEKSWFFFDFPFRRKMNENSLSSLKFNNFFENLFCLMFQSSSKLLTKLFSA